MELISLHAFIAVAETGSFSEAAERLFITQPAVSKRIASLETELDTQLFDRIGRKTYLTQAGSALLPRAHKILLEFDDTKREIANLSGHVSGTLSVGTSHHIGLHRLPPVLRAYSNQYPNVRLDIKFIDSEEAFDAVQQGTMELGIVTLPPQGSDPLYGQNIWDDPLTCVVAPDHPLATAAQERGKLALTDLTHHEAILPSKNTFTRKIVESLLAETNMKLEVIISTNYLETIRMMVAIGLGWSVLPASMVDESIIAVDVEGVNLKRNLGVVYHPNRSLSNAAKELLQLLESFGTGN